jgi:pyruvate/2-oxoglutarate dehydrogenase complex dihydrolipoamide acyltransferase (E2) component
VLRLAEEHQIPLAALGTLEGTGAGGRVTKEDVLRFAAGRVAGAPAGAAAPAAHAGDQIMKLSPIRRSIAQRMAQSKREIPHAYGVIEAEMSAVVAWREANKDAWRRDGVSLTYTAFFVQAVAEALRGLPVVNSSWSEEGILLRKAVNIGVGIAIDEGWSCVIHMPTSRPPGSRARSTT